MANHKTTNISINYTTKTGSRERVRIPTLGVFSAGVYAGMRVSVARVGKRVVITQNPTGNYKVEKNGAVRFPASKFGLNPKKVKIVSDVLNQQVNVA